MKKRILPLLLVLALGIITLCFSFSPNNNHYTPYFMVRSELERSVKYIDGARDMENPGKIYVKGNYILINEKYKGVHIVDNTTPSNPQAIGFVYVPGCIDMAVKDNILYVDNSVDLVAFDLTAKEEISRVKNCLDEPLSPVGEPYYGSRPVGTILVGWKKNNR